MELFSTNYDVTRGRRKTAELWPTFSCGMKTKKFGKNNQWRLLKLFLEIGTKSKKENLMEKVMHGKNLKKCSKLKMTELNEKVVSNIIFRVLFISFSYSGTYNNVKRTSLKKSVDFVRLLLFLSLMHYSPEELSVYSQNYDVIE